ncbi:ATP-binding protein [Chloroflexota bacterium]
MKVKAKLENLSAIADFLDETMEEFGIPEHTYAVKTAVDEACSNVMLYGYPEGEGDIDITCEVGNGVLTITIRDKGLSFDPDKVPPPDLESDLEHRRIGGLGIYFLKTLMDEVTYSFKDDGNSLVLKKRYSS